MARLEHVFVEKGREPGPAALARALGPAHAHWDALLGFVEAEAPSAKPEWRFYGARYGWQLKVVEGKRALLYLVPHAGSFLAALALRRPALEAVRAAGVPAALLREIEAAKPGPEGHPARVEVRTAKDLKNVERLVRAKLGRPGTAHARGPGAHPSTSARVPALRAGTGLRSG